MLGIRLHRACLRELAVTAGYGGRMSAVTQPRGPLPARVYWTRRALVLAVALVLVFGLAKVLGGGSDGKSQDPGQAAVVSGDPTGTGSTRPRPRTTAKATKKSKPVLAQPDGPCAAAEVTVEGRISRTANDGDVRIPLVLRGERPACTFSASDKTIVVKIVSGDDNIWTSQQCGGIEARDVVVRSAVGTRVMLVWHGRRSDEDCSQSTAWADTGYYHVIAATLGGEPSDVQFALTSPPVERITVTASPKARKKNR